MLKLDKGTLDSPPLNYSLENVCAVFIIWQKHCRALNSLKRCALVLFVYLSPYADLSYFGEFTKHKLFPSSEYISESLQGEIEVTESWACTTF